MLYECARKMDPLHRDLMFKATRWGIGIGLLIFDADAYAILCHFMKKKGFV